MELLLDTEEMYRRKSRKIDEENTNTNWPSTLYKYKFIKHTYTGVLVSP